MKSSFRIPLVFLALGALIGVMLRWQFVAPVKGLHFMNWLHAHSHVMFLGWVTNMLFLGFVYTWCKEKWSSRFRVMFWLLQVVIVGLMVAFPLQGYGLFSISLLTLHNVLSYLYCFRLNVGLKGYPAESARFAQHALLFFVISTFGAFAVGPIAANGLGQSKWYYFAIFFYLHFQYNGFFLFGILALMLNELERRGVVLPERKVRFFRKTLFYACFPAYFLSLLWSESDVITRGVSIFAGSLQVVSLVVFFQLLSGSGSALWRTFRAAERAFLVTAFLSFALKIVLQLLSAVPALSELAFEVRFFILAYLHLVLIGCISVTLLAWLSTRSLLAIPMPAAWAFLLAFMGSEAAMGLVPVFGSLFSIFSAALLVFSVVMALFFIMLPSIFHREIE